MEENQEFKTFPYGTRKHTFLLLCALPRQLHTMNWVSRLVASCNSIRSIVVFVIYFLNQLLQANNYMWISGLILKHMSFSSPDCSRKSEQSISFNLILEQQILIQGKGSKLTSRSAFKHCDLKDKSYFVKNPNHHFHHQQTTNKSSSHYFIIHITIARFVHTRSPRSICIGKSSLRESCRDCNRM